MNKKTVKELVNCTNAIARAMGAIGATLDTICAILANAESAEAANNRTYRTHRTYRGQGAGAEAAAQEPERLPDVPDWRDGAARQEADDELTRIRLTVAAHQGDGLAEIIEAILGGGTDLKTLAQILGVNRARISEAKHGHARPGFVARFAEVLGCDGGAGTRSGGPGGRSGRSGRGAGTGVAANCRGKRGAK